MPERNKDLTEAKRIFRFWKHEIRQAMPRTDTSHQIIWMAFWAGYRAAQTVDNEDLVPVKDLPLYLQRSLSGEVLEDPATVSTRKRSKITPDDAVKARIAYDNNHDLASEWMDAENALTPAQYEEYQNKYRKHRLERSVVTLPEHHQPADTSLIQRQAAIIAQEAQLDPEYMALLQRRARG